MAEDAGKAHTGLALDPRIGCAEQREKEKEGTYHDHRDIVQSPSLHHRHARRERRRGPGACRLRAAGNAHGRNGRRRAGGQAPPRAMPLPKAPPPPTFPPGWEKRPAITDADCAETVDCEVLVIGAGCSGLVAANFAAMEGAKTLLIEKFDKGTGLRGSAIGAVGSRKQQEAGVNIDRRRSATIWCTIP